MGSILGSLLFGGRALCGSKTSAEFRALAWAPVCIAIHRSEEHTSELQSRENLVCRLLLEKKKKFYNVAPLIGIQLRSVSRLMNESKYSFTHHDSFWIDSNLEEIAVYQHIINCSLLNRI